MSVDFEHMLKTTTKIKAGLQWGFCPLFFCRQRVFILVFILAGKRLNSDPGYYFMRLNEKKNVNSGRKHKSLQKWHIQEAYFDTMQLYCICCKIFTLNAFMLYNSQTTKIWILLFSWCSQRCTILLVWLQESIFPCKTGLKIFKCHWHYPNLKQK